ncbi:MAG: B12-binding domain-containing radical SAM protein [Planctomycetota bacterium]|nr:MAG: B12-binding domain-containing radical SAM protein [Planctomycetota bacterium]
MLHVGFILPPDTVNFAPFRNQPLTVLYLMSILEERLGNKIELSLIDLRGVDKKYINYYIPEMDVYAYTAMSPEFSTICKIRDVIRSIYPKSLHIVGGPHIIIFKEKTSEGFDSIAIGEGEEIISQIIKDILANNLKPVYENSDAIDLDKYPYPFRKYLPYPSVVDTGILDGENKHLLGTNALFSRGCPFNCYFCAKIILGTTRFRAPKLIEEEIEYLKREYKVEALAIKDDNSIPIDKKIAKPFLEAIGRTGVKWRGQSRANGISEDMVKLAKESGCADIGVGIESMSPKALKLVNKKIDLDQAKEYINILHKYEIGVRLNFLFGLPGESEDIVSRTLDFIDETKPKSVLLSLLCPMPGTKIANNPDEFGMRITNKNWDDYYTVFGRFDENEKPHLLFKYKKTTPWGESLSAEKILNNYNELQAILRDRNLIF